MSCLLCCFKTLTLCGLRDFIVKSLAFCPPAPKTYDLIQIETRDPTRAPVYKLVMISKSGNKLLSEEIPGIESSAFWLQTKTGTRIPALFFHNKASTSNLVLLYSHGNATDLGQMRPYLLELAYTLNVHVFAYEYYGYGPTKGNCNDMEIVYDAIAAYEELTKKMHFRWNQIILYGRSIGTGPTLYLASHPQYPVSGVILHSPLASGLRMFDLNMSKTYKYDMFPNSDLIDHVKCPVFIMHGEMDKEVPIDHGKLLSTKCKNLVNPWWAPEGGHNDLDVRFRKTYFIRLNRFIKQVRDMNMIKSYPELDEMYRADPWHNTFEHIYPKKEKTIEENWKKTQKVSRPSTDYYIVPSNTSLLTSQSITASTYRTNHGETSLFTTMGDQTARRNGLDSARTAYESEIGKDGDCTTSKLADEKSPVKEQSIDIGLSSSRFKTEMFKGITLEGSETTRVKDEEAEPEQEKAKELENIVKGVYPSPYDLSFDNSQFITHMKTGNIDLDSKQDVDTKQAD